MGNRLTMESHQIVGTTYPELWRSTQDIHKGTQWEDFVIHYKWSDDPKVGFIELWHNGVRQTFDNGQQRRYLATIVPSVNGIGNTVIMNIYREAGVNYGTTTVYHDDVRVGTTYNSVAR
jgi:hypothetical protein